MPLYPEFVVELRPPADSRANLQAKMQEYLENGAKLGWVIDPENRRVCVYRSQEPVRELQNPENVSGDPVLPGFVLDLREI